MRRLDVFGVCAAVAVGTVVGAALITRDAVAYLLRGDDDAHLTPIHVDLTRVP